MDSHTFDLEFIDLAHILATAEAEVQHHDSPFPSIPSDTPFDEDRPVQALPGNCIIC
uniref:Putative pheromone n=1 Tax=Flammulina velutipes TaxID=38945 RepID=A0A1B2U707_FLAVE|nr:putative pheromone precursor [Flammulina velutipes]